MIPSKKILILIVVILVCFGAWFLWDHLSSIQSTTVQNQNPNQEVRVTKTDDDTDGDGLYDWEEQLHNTNIRIRDTDGDGISDGEEVQGGYDPAVYGQGVNFEVSPAKDLFGEFVFTPIKPEQTDDQGVDETEQPSAHGVNEKYIPILNEMANSVTRYPVIETTDNDAFTALFTPGKSIDSQIPRYQKVIENHRRVATSLDGLTNKAGLELEIIRLVQGYNRVADSLEKLVAAYPLYAEQETLYVDAVIEYSNAVVSLQRQLYTVTEFIYAKGIRFKAGDTGVLFLFGG